MSRISFENDCIKYILAEDVWENDKFRRLALDNSLYQSVDWYLFGYLSDEMDYELDNIALAFYDGIPVGVCVCVHYGHTMFYVKEEFRRQGIGRNLAELMKKNIDRKKYGEMGIPESKYFFKSIGITLK